MKEKMKVFFKSKENEYWYGADSEKMSALIDEFFDSYQPENLQVQDSNLRPMT
jgi:hypothetical protein